MINGKISRRTLMTRITGLFAIYTASMLKIPVAMAKEVTHGLRKIKGKIIERRDNDYENWRSSMVWYVFKPKRYPDIIVRAQSEQDVIEAVNYARDNNLKVAIRNTGHHITAAALRNGGVLIDLSQLNKVQIDPVQRTAWIGPAIRSVELVKQLNEHDLTFPAAHTAVVGLGGFLLGGGLGWNLQQWGVACHSVIAADIVTADGKKVTATEQVDQDLLWALRGAGPTFFGVVTRLKLKLYSQPKVIIKNTYIFKHDQIASITAILDKLVKVRDERVEILTILKHGEDVSAVSEKGVILIVNVIAFASSQGEAELLLQAFAGSSLSTKSIFKKEGSITSYSKLYAAQSVTDGTSQYRTTSENMWTDKPGQALRVLSDHFTDTKSRHSFVLAVYGVKAMPDSNTSLSYFANNYVVCTMVTDKEEHIEANFKWMDKAVELMRPMVKGRYINEVEARRYPAHVRECFSEQNWDHLLELRRQYDPHSLFFTYPDGTR